MLPESNSAPWLAVLAQYGIQEITSLTAGGGTALPKVLVDTGHGRFLLRQRRPRWSLPEVVAFDHGVIQRVAAAGLPVPLPLRTQHGKTWAHVDGVTYEMFPYMEGLGALETGNLAQITSAALALARFHRATAAGHLPGQKEWPREHEIQVMAQTLAQELDNRNGHDPALGQAKEMLASAQELAKILTPATMASLPHVVIHGDYTPANILFRGQVVGGIFDFDWVSRQPRLIDVGEAIEFFAFPRPTPIDPDDIWSLVQGWEPDVEAMRAFLTAYQSLFPLGEEEAVALPLFMRETWLGIRIRAMRKVSPDCRLVILTKDALEPLHWLEDEAQLLQRTVRATQP